MTCLALDIGGTKLMAALVDGAQVIDVRRIATDRAAGPAAWLDAAQALCAGWKGRYSALGLAVTGAVDARGLWSALNPETLNIPPRTPLTELAEARFGLPALARNDAQAAAWAEHRFGAGQGRDTVFLTISTGLGGGIVSGGRLLSGRCGLAGHFGQTGGAGTSGRFEDEVAGRWLARAARAQGRALEAPEIFAAARAGETWAEDLRTCCAERVARLCADIQAMFDPEVIVIGGGIGLSENFVETVDAHLPEAPDLLRPALARAGLGAEAGVIGIADLARSADRSRAK